MKYTLLLGLVLTAASTTHGMDYQNKTKKTTPKATQKNINKNAEIHKLFQQGRHKEATKQLPSKMASLVNYSKTANDPQFVLWVESKANKS